MKASYRTPQKPQLQHPRSAESSNRRSKETQLKRGDSNEQQKKSQKVIGKSLNSAFTSVSEDILQETNESIDSSPYSEVTDYNQPIELSEFQNFVLSPNPTSSEIFDPAAFSTSLTIIDDKQETVDGSSDFENLKPENVEVQVLEHFLREAQFQLSRSSNIDQLSKKLLDALIKIVIEDFYSLHQDQDKFSELTSTKAYIGFFCFLLWIVSVSAVLFSNSAARSSFPGPPPT